MKGTLSKQRRRTSRRIANRWYPGSTGCAKLRFYCRAEKVVMDNVLDSWCGACGRKGRLRAVWVAAEVVGRRAPRNSFRTGEDRRTRTADSMFT